MLSKRELAFLIIWGMIFFPLLLIWLHLYRALDAQTISYLLVYMAGLKVVYVGAKGFDSWNSSDPPTTNIQIDNGGH